MRLARGPVLALALFTALGTAGAAVAQSPDTSSGAVAPIDDLIAGAQAEGSLTLYTALDPATATALGEAFQAKYGVALEFARMTSGDLTARYATEAEANVYTADLIIISADPFFDTAVERGWMFPMDAALVPEAAAIPARFLYPSSVALGLARSSNILINTDLVTGDAVPDSWQDLLDPTWKDQLLTGDPRGVPVALAAWQVLSETLGEDFVRALVAQNIDFQSSMVGGVQLIAAGERKGGFGGSQVHVNPLLETAPDAPIAILPMTGPEFGYEWRGGVSAKSAHPNAARLFVNWLLTPEGQTLLLEGIGPSVRPDVVLPQHAPMGADFISLDTARALASRPELLELIGLPAE